MFFEKFIKRSSFLFCLALVFCGVLSFPGSAPAAQAIGLSPSTLDFKQLRNTNVITKKLYISRGNSEVDQYYQIKLNGDAARYVTLSTDILRIPSGSNRASVDVTVFPDSAPNGNYEASVTISALDAPSGESIDSGNAVTVLVGVQGKIKFSVTDEQLQSFSILSVNVDDIEVRQPLRLYYSIENLGNVDIRPEKIVVNVVDSTDPENRFVHTFTASELNFVEMGTRREDEILEVNHGLGEGRYDINTEFYLQGKIVHESDPVRIHILPEGTLTAEATFSTLTRSPAEDVKLGSLVVFNGNVDNTGTKLVEPTFYVEIKRDGQTIDLLKSETRQIRPGKNSVYTLTFRPDVAGEYTASAYFEYNIKRTESKETTFTVLEDAVSFLSTYGYYLVGGGVTLFVVLLIIFILWRRKSKDDENQNNMYMPPTQPPTINGGAPTDQFDQSYQSVQAPMQHQMNPSVPPVSSPQQSVASQQDQTSQMNPTQAAAQSAQNYDPLDIYSMPIVSKNLPNNQNDSTEQKNIHNDDTSTNQKM